jgi:hypothetical protein
MIDGPSLNRDPADSGHHDLVGDNLGSAGWIKVFDGAKDNNNKTDDNIGSDKESSDLPEFPFLKLPPATPVSMNFPCKFNAMLKVAKFLRLRCHISRRRSARGFLCNGRPIDVDLEQDHVVWGGSILAVNTTFRE